ncbi:hypothetical protein ASPCAL07669 [Aspergillus calidoustus]|uniref:Uncharacterized protein n=1 Tax=Aspergillus calidoustus TaxID=454130 RepID=A0A0U5GQM2_ASPCI|nr:hypothetical protein ASPCAL07669 [Aspergillus calidoustus]
MQVLSEITFTTATVLAIASVTTAAPAHKNRASIQDDLIGSPCTDNAECGHPANGLTCSFGAANATQGICLDVEETGIPVSTINIEQADEDGETEEDLYPLVTKPKKCRRLHQSCYWHEDCCEGMGCAEVNMIGLPGLCKKWRVPRPKPKPTMEDGGDEVDAANNATGFE